MRSRVFIAITTVCVVMAWAPWAASGRALDAPDGEVAFVSTRHGQADIWTVRVADGRERRMTRHPAADTLPRWSPDGSQLLFISLRDGQGRVYTMTARGEKPRALTPATLPAVFAAAWSPDGRRVAFLADGSSGVPGAGTAEDLYVINADGSGLRALRRSIMADGIFGEAPVRSQWVWARTALSWSPDGREVAFADRSDIWAAPADGGEARNLTANVWGQLVAPEWSPDGMRVAATGVSQEHSVIQLFSADGTSEIPVGSVFRDSAGKPSWSADSGSLAFHELSCPAGAPCHFVIANANVDGTGGGRLADDPALSAAEPGYSPDGRWVAYRAAPVEAFCFGNPCPSNLYVVSADGTVRRRLTDARGGNWLPDWRPEVLEESSATRTR